ncbi:phosphoribosylformylglycinamidine synthase subunit PurL [Acrasis kona]|uniref:Phosphoribosylformylglycinamidine synthase subunit PurL n=1 Tax=Acrasis kona TaxID=1008807 RepID=A0AAW2ZH36_9EUKA
MDDTDDLRTVLDRFEVERAYLNGKFTYDLARYFVNFANRKNDGRPRIERVKQKFIDVITKSAPQMDISAVITSKHCKKKDPNSRLARNIYVMDRVLFRH